MTTGNQVAPTSTALQARVLLYQPTKRPQERQGEWLETPHGRCRVTGRLGQRHADVVEAILYVAEKRRDISDGGVELLVDPAKVRRAMSDHNYSLGRIQALLRDLRSATVEIITPQMQLTGDRVIGGLIDHVIPSPMTRRNPLGGERRLWRVRLGVGLVMLLERDLSLYYSPGPIARLTHGVSQAIARHILTHRQCPAGGWHLDTLIRAVSGSDLSGTALRNARRAVHADTRQLRESGVQISPDNRITRVAAAR